MSALPLPLLWLIACVVPALTVIWLAPHFLRWIGWRKPGQRRRARKARRCLKVLASIDAPERKIAYMRKLDPFVFEELILEAFERHGHRVQRNQRYTGDGGIDGRVWLNGELHLIQAKRYAGHVSAAHIRDFGAVVQSYGCKGLFVHTGRTGAASRKAVTGNHIRIISGQTLLHLVSVSPQCQAETALDPNLFAVGRH